MKGSVRKARSGGGSAAATLLAVTALGLLASEAPAEEVRVSNVDALRKAVRAAKPGTKILLEPGEYSGGMQFDNVGGDDGSPITIAAADPAHPPVIRGGSGGLHLTDAVHVVLESLVVAGATGNGINIDDGGSFDTPARRIVLRKLQVRDIGAKGNQDGIKLSGVTDFVVEDCTIERWGTGGGSGIDMVGCHRGVIERCTFRHVDEEGSTGVQAKGGSSDLTVRSNRFERAGGRGVNAGGSTGLPFFRPPLEGAAGAEGTRCEAKRIVVEGNVFVGGGAAVAFVGVDGATFRFNTVYRPKRWACRILQENRSPGFVPSRNGEFTDNLVVFEAGAWGGAANVGPNTAPETFRFARNVWYAVDAPASSRPSLPAKEDGGVWGKDPLLADPDRGDFSVPAASPAHGAGAHAYAPLKTRGAPAEPAAK